MHQADGPDSTGGGAASGGKFDKVTNVVKLPGAATRQVKQHCNAQARAARHALREASPWPGKLVTPMHSQQWVSGDSQIARQDDAELALAMVKLIDAARHHDETRNALLMLARIADLKAVAK